MCGCIKGGLMRPVFLLEDQEVITTTTTFVEWRQENVPRVYQFGEFQITFWQSLGVCIFGVFQKHMENRLSICATNKKTNTNTKNGRFIMCICISGQQKRLTIVHENRMVLLCFLVQKQNRTSLCLLTFYLELNIHIPTYLGTRGNPFFWI
jgi:hypothetical protein